LCAVRRDVDGAAASRDAGNRRETQSRARGIVSQPQLAQLARGIRVRRIAYVMYWKTGRSNRSTNPWYERFAKSLTLSFQDWESSDQVPFYWCWSSKKRNVNDHRSNKVWFILLGSKCISLIGVKSEIYGGEGRRRRKTKIRVHRRVIDSWKNSLEGKILRDQWRWPMEMIARFLSNMEIRIWK